MKKSVLMIGGGIQQVDSAKAIRAAGYNLIVADRSSTSPCFEVADHCLVADGTDIETITAYVLKNKQAMNIAGVFSLVNLTTSAAFVAHACGLPGVPPAAAVAAQNKALMKACFRENGIATPSFFEATSMEEAEVAFDALGGHVMVKATNLFGGQGIREVLDKAELKDVMENMQALSGYSGLLIEEVVEGRFVDLNGIFMAGNFYRAGHICSDFLTEYPEGKKISPIENVIRCPGNVSSDELDSLYALFERAHRALGTDFGPVGADAILTPKGPMLIEVGPRLHSPTCTYYMVPNALGPNALKAAVNVMAGDALDPEDLRFGKGEATMTELVLWRPGKLKDVVGFEEAASIPGVLKLYLHKKPGETIPQYTNSTQIPFAVIAKGKTPADAQKVIDAVKATVKPIYE